MNTAMKPMEPAEQGMPAVGAGGARIFEPAATSPTADAAAAPAARTRTGWQRAWRLVNTAIVLVVAFAPWMTACGTLPLRGYQVVLFQAQMTGELAQRYAALMTPKYWAEGGLLEAASPIVLLGVAGMALYALASLVTAAMPRPRRTAWWLTIPLALGVVGMLASVAQVATLGLFWDLQWGYWLAWAGLGSGLALEATGAGWQRREQGLPATRGQQVFRAAGALTVVALLPVIGWHLTHQPVTAPDVFFAANRWRLEAAVRWVQGQEIYGGGLTYTYLTLPRQYATLSGAAFGNDTAPSEVMVNLAPNSDPQAPVFFLADVASIAFYPRLPGGLGQWVIVYTAADTPLPGTANLAKQLAPHWHREFQSWGSW